MSFLPDLRLVLHIGDVVNRNKRLRVLAVDEGHQALVFAFVDDGDDLVVALQIVCADGFIDRGAAVQFVDDELPLKMEGLNIDAVYENFVRQIAGDKLSIEKTGESLKESVEREEQRQTVQKQIEALKAKIKKEKQLNKQMEMNNELKKLKRELEEI